MTAAPLGVLVRHIHRLAADGAPRPATDRQLLEEFAAHRDEAAFAELVARHGPMVLRVCRRLLRQEQDAEDAFQATFLVLARNGGSIRTREALAGWLYGVAYRIATKAKRSAARRRDHEGRAGASAPRATPDPSWNDVQDALDREVERLPGPFRAAFALCVLEGKTVPEAAAALGCKMGTVSSRLTRARRLLRERLARRGIALSALLAALAVAEGPARAALPAALAKAAVRYGLMAAARETAAGTIPPHLVALADGATGALIAGKLRVATAVLLAVGVVAAAGALARQGLVAREEPGGQKSPAAGKATEPAGAKEAQGEKGDGVEVSGRVVDPDGRPVTGARLVFLYASAEKVPEKVWATSAADGRFHFPVGKALEDADWPGDPWDNTYVVAAAKGHGFAWARVRPGAAADLTLRLVTDDVPLEGRVLDLQGKPVAGATVRIDQGVSVPKKGDLTGWLKALKADKQNPDDAEATDLIDLRSPAFAALFPPVRTWADGRFRINRIGRERVASLRVEGPTIATQLVNAMTRSVETIRLTPPNEPGVTYHGASFDVLAVPTRPVVGVVRDKDSGKPLAGVAVRSHRIAGTLDLNGLSRTTTDKEGRYRLTGLPKGPGNAVIAEAYGHVPQADDLPYLPSIRDVAETPGLEPVTVDLPLKRGIWVRGRVVDKATNKPVQAGFDYFCFADNPLASELPLLGGIPGGWTRKDGTFRTVAVPGRGLIAVRANEDRYRMGVGADRIKARVDDGPLLATVPYQLYPGNAHTIVEVSPKPGDEEVTCDVVLDPGHTIKGTVVDPDGNPLAGTRTAGLIPMGYWVGVPLKGADFTITGLGPDEVRLLQVVHEEKKLAGWLVVRGNEEGPVRVKLEPWGTLTGRLVTADGEPVTNVVVHSSSHVARDGTATGSFALGARVGTDGRFSLEGLAPGLKYNLGVLKDPNIGLPISGKAPRDLTLRPGETRDLGDIQVKPLK
jgi:RNA polymerase sigma factor (sigma-70 family)